MHNRCNCGGGFVAGAVLGALIGAGVALLYAPQSGEVTRKQLKTEAAKAKERGLAMRKEAMDKMEEVKDEAAEKVEEYKTKAQRAAKELKSDKA